MYADDFDEKEKARLSSTDATASNKNEDAAEPEAETSSSQDLAGVDGVYRIKNDLIISELFVANGYIFLFLQRFPGSSSGLKTVRKFMVHILQLKCSNGWMKATLRYIILTVCFRTNKI
jgi:hypothetical protein